MAYLQSGFYNVSPLWKNAARRFISFIYPTILLRIGAAIYNESTALRGKISFTGMLSAAAESHKWTESS